MGEESLAEDRTDWAEDRTILANERTFAGWMRTGMACVAIAIGLQAVFGAVEPTGAAKVAATVFIVIAVLIFWVAWRNSSKMIARLDSHSSEPVSKNHFGSIAVLLTVGAVLSGLVLWLV